MFNQYTCNVTTGSTGQHTMFMGLDLSNLKPECALGESAPINKELTLDKKVYKVSDLMVEISRPQKPKQPKLGATKKQIANYKKKLEEYPEKYKLYSNSTKLNLMLNMMLNEGVVTRNSKIKVGHDGRLKEVFVVDSKESYRMFGNTYYGKFA